MGRPASDEGFQIETDPKTVADHMRRWQDAMCTTPGRSGDKCWLAEEGISIKFFPRRATHGVLGADLATNRRCNPATIEINMPSKPGTVDGAAHVGRDPQGRLWLLRQGRLQSQRQGTPIFDGPTFSALTALPWAFVTRAQRGSPARWWYQVCRLDVDPVLMRAQTVDFVRRCQRARDLVSAGNIPDPAAPEAEHAQNLRGNLEPAGVHVIPPQDARVVERLHATVVNALIAQLDARGIENRKVWSADGYEVDLSIDGGNRPILVEVKTGATAREVETGVGQLMLYRQLMPMLRDHVPVLLAPSPPTEALEAAVAGCGIEWHVYRWIEERTVDGNVEFDDAFWRLFGAR